MVKDIPIVFVVDDDPSIRESLSLLLSSAGYGVKTFASAKEFLESDLGTPTLACLVLDVRIWLPDFIVFIVSFFPRSPVNLFRNIYVKNNS